MLRDRFRRQGIEARVHSAGLLLDGEPAADFGVQVMGDRGLDISSHRSRRATAQLLADADLVLAMARLHVREAALLNPGVWPRAFTLKELVRRAEASPRHRAEPFDLWLSRVHAGRAREELLGESELDDVADPIGAPRQVYERTADELTELVDRLVLLAWGREAA